MRGRGIYDFVCKDCGKQFEDLVDSAEARPECPRCESQNTRLAEGIQHNPIHGKHGSWPVRGGPR